MSKATKRKHVAREVLDDFVVPDENQQIVKVLGGRGNNLHEAESPEGKTFLVSMPTKFRKNVWIKRGDFVVVEPIEEGHKVCAEIVHILYAKQVKYLKKENLWPSAFSDKLQEDQLANQDDKENFSKPRDDSIPSDEKDSSDEDDDSDLFVNTNRMTFVTNVESESESECDEDDDDDENCKQGEIFL